LESLTLDAFIESTLDYLRQHGPGAFLPTLIPPGRPAAPLMLIRGIPEEVDHREAIQRVILDTGLAEGSFLFCVRSGRDELVGGRYTPVSTEFFAIRETGGRYLSGRIPPCPWWRVAPRGRGGPGGSPWQREPPHA